VLSVIHSNVSLLAVFVMKPKYVVTEVLMLYLVLDLSLKHSVKHVLTVIFLDEVDKVGRSSFY